MAYQLAYLAIALFSLVCWLQGMRRARLTPGYKPFSWSQCVKMLVVVTLLSFCWIALALAFYLAYLMRPEIVRAIATKLPNHTDPGFVPERV